MSAVYIVEFAVSSCYTIAEGTAFLWKFMLRNEKKGTVMKVTFICHSSFCVELERHVLVFDYYGDGKLPKAPADSRIYFLNSHAHPDHFKKEILGLRDRCPKAEYVLSRDIRLRPDERKNWIHQVKARAEYEIGELKIRTLRSTDQGVAWAVEAEGKRIYHAGDLNWWHWEGEDRAWNNNMAANYKREVDRLAGQSFDAAFVPLDPRLSGACDWGMKYFLEQVDAAHVFPMHFWEEYDICRKVKEEKEMQGLLEHYHTIEYQGQEWTLC